MASGYFCLTLRYCFLRGVTVIYVCYFTSSSGIYKAARTCEERFNKDTESSIMIVRVERKFVYIKVGRNRELKSCART